MALKRPRQNALADIETGVSPSEVRYLALYTVAPTATTEGTEVTGGSYARQVITFDAAVDGIGEQNADCDFPAATADWGTIVAWAVHDASTGAGNQRFFRAITPKLVGTGDTAEFPAGTITFRAD